uniref:Doublecortin domain containing 1 n=1 Tax=Erpetoichthys calabaricus TaxID=27687 RepID=A0A8C4X559_ERPCA
MLVFICSQQLLCWVTTNPLHRALLFLVASKVTLSGSTGAQSAPIIRKDHACFIYGLSLLQLLFLSQHRLLTTLSRQPCIIKVMAYKNGSRSVYARVAAPTMKMLLEECTLKLMLNSAARRVFLANGKEAHEPQDIPHGADVYISTGEPFADPLKKIKDHLSLSKEASWTINGIVFPNDAKRGRTKPSLSKRMRKLTAKNTIRLLVFKNGTGKDGCEVISAVDQIEKFLDQCTVRLNLTSPARVLFDWDGKRIEDISQVPMLDSCLQNSITPLRGPIWVSKGEGFSPSGAKVYIQGVIWALHEKLKPSREYSEQLNWALDNCIEKITRKDILSLTTEDLYNNKEKVDNLIDELQAAIKKHKGQLFKLTPQLQAEEQQCAGYVYQHIKQLSTSGGVLQGLQLKVYENGQSTGGITVYLNRKEVERGCENDIKTMMDRLLQMIHQRLQFCADYSPSGLNLFPTSLDLILRGFIYFIYIFHFIIYCILLPVCTFLFRWEACVGFPENYNYSSQQLVYHQHITVDFHSHFLQLKEDPQVVIYASITVTSRILFPLVLKAGVILSRAMPQLCLAADDHSITLRTKDGASVEAYKLRIQKRYLLFFCKLHRCFLEEVTQTEEYNHQGAWSAEHQKTDSSFANKVKSNVSDTNQTQVSRPIDTQPMPSGVPVESPQLTVALVRKLEDKHPKATAQRWAIKHEGTAKVGQWKFSKVENPLWNKLTYMWPVLPNGDLNEEFNWPLEGSLIPHAPPLRKPSILHAPESHIHIRLRVLRNGEKDQTKAITTTGPDIGGPGKCTVILNLPFAARRLFDADGRELTDLKVTQRDQLVYVSCGEKFIDPKLSVAEYKKRIILSNLESDISLIRNYWAMHRNEGALSLSFSFILLPFSVSINIVTSSISTHLNHMVLFLFFPRPLPLSVRNLPVHRQQFEFKDGYISNCKVPSLVVGVLGGVVQLGSEIHLVEKKPDDINQRWIPIEEDRYGVANQKWGWISDIKVLSAFYSTQMDQEITAANQASLCTFTVSGKEELDQQGFFFYTNQSNTNTKITVCLACARALRGKIILTKLPPGNSFSCATGCKKSRLNPSGPFKCLSVVKVGTDLFASEAENTLRYYEEILNSLRKETSMQTISQEISAARTQQSVKIMAYRNGAGYKDGQLIIATTMPMLLSMCTTRLELSSAACRLYTADGTPVFRVSELMAWAVNECFLASNTEEQEENQDSELAIHQEDDTASGKLAQDIPENNKSLKPAFKSKHVHITSETLDSLDEMLLTLILRNPVDVWVSCGEPFLPLQALEKKEQTQKQNWLHKEKALADLVKKRHKMRHLEGRRISAMLPCRMIPTKSPVQPVVVEGGWMEPSQEEVKLMEDIQNIEVHLAEVQNVQSKKQIHFVQNISACEGDLYHLPSVKRVLVFVNGGNLKEGVFAWGKSIEELLDSCTIKLGMRKSAQILYTLEGKEISSMDEIERDMVICASSGEPFMTTKAKKQSIEIRANYARVRKDEGPEATDIVVNPKRNPKVRVSVSSQMHSHTQHTTSLSP